MENQHPGTGELGAIGILVEELVFEATESQPDAYEAAAIAQELMFPKLDGVLFPLVVTNADVVAPCQWMGGAEVSLTVALNNYPQQMSEENADDVLADVYDFLASQTEIKDELQEKEKIEGTIQVLEQTPNVGDTKQAEKGVSSSSLRTSDVRESPEKVERATRLVEVPMLQNNLTPQEDASHFVGIVKKAVHSKSTDSQIAVHEALDKTPFHSAKSKNDEKAVTNDHEKEPFGAQTVGTSPHLGADIEVQGPYIAPPEEDTNLHETLEVVHLHDVQESFSSEVRETELGPRASDWTPEVEVKTASIDEVLLLSEEENEDFEDEPEAVIPVDRIDESVSSEEPAEIIDVERLIHNDAVATEVEASLIELAQCVEGDSLDMPETANETLDKIAEVVLKAEVEIDESIEISRVKIEKEIEALLTGLFHDTPLAQESERIKLLAYVIARQLIIEREADSLDEGKTRAISKLSVKVHTLIRGLVVAIGAIKNSLARAVIMGRSVLKLCILSA